MRLIPILVCATATILGACGGSAQVPAQSPSAATDYVATSLMADLATFGDPERRHADPRLVNPWGIAVAPRAYAWVANHGTSTARRYDGNGNVVPRGVMLAPGVAGEARPTGVVFDAAQRFRATEGALDASCLFIVVGRSGTVTCWQPAATPLESALQPVDEGATHAQYTAAAIAERGSGAFLYAVDFRNRTVDVFDTCFTKVAVAGRFVDPDLPADYAPFGIQAIGGRLYVAYAKQDATGEQAMAGTGLGLVDAYDSEGRLVQRVVAPGGTLNMPWGMAQAPEDFGGFSRALLVANGGDGTIAAYDATTGAFLGALAQSGRPLVIDGLRGIAFGRGLADVAQDVPSLYYTAAPGGGDHGTYGRVDVR